MIRKLAIASLLALAIGMGSVPAHAQEAFVNPKANIAPEAKPNRQNAGEGMPPLPLPATALRRSEKKREPSPPALIGNITFPSRQLQQSGAAWGTTVIDVERWVKWSNNQLGQKYRFVNTDFARFSYDPAELPILYFTGWQTMPDLDDATIVKLRQYLTDGGTLVVHSSCGRPEFNTSFARQIKRIFPDREMSGLPSDHPIYSSFYPITQMKVRQGSKPWQTIRPQLESVYIGTRAAVIFSPIDLSCGWDANANPIEGGILYDQQDALKLGCNIVTYCLAEYQYGRFYSQQKVYHQADDQTRDQLVLGQIVHNGDWDATPHGLPNLLKSIDQTTTLNVQFKRVPVDPAADDIFSFPVLYMAGQRDFRFSDTAARRLRQYLDQGGVLIVDDVVGASEFDLAFRREIAKVYPDQPLKPLPLDHPMFTYVNDVRQVQLAPLGQQRNPSLRSPRILAIEIEGTLPVLYSPLSLSAGWEQLPRAYDNGYSDADSLKLGINLLMYSITH